MPSTCTFQLNRANATYFSGETISGTIVLETTSDKNVRDVSIIFLGEAKVQWTEYRNATKSNSNTTNRTVYYTANESYINNETAVHGDGTLPAGVHNYTFNIQLPWECPTSFEGKYGHIRYEILLKINRYYRFDNIFKNPVTIIKTVDLNLNPAYKMPIEIENFTSSCCWTCSSGKLFSTLKIPYGAYAPGQIVKYVLHIVNQSMNDTEGYSLEFRQKIVFTAKSPHHKERHVKQALVSTTFPDKCLRLTNRVYNGEFLIPPTTSSTERSSIIYVEYTLKVTVQLPCCLTDPDLIIPIIIGTIPIRESLQFSGEQQQLLPTAPEMEQEQNDAVGGDLLPNYNQFKPPTFEEATRSSSPIIDTDVDEKIA